MPVAPDIALTCDIILSNPLYVFTVSARPALTPRNVAPCAIGFFAAFATAPIGDVTAFTTLIVAVNTLPSQAAALSITSSITGLALSSAPSSAVPEVPSNVATASSALRIICVAVSSASTHATATSPFKAASASSTSIICMVALSSAVSSTTASFPFRTESESPTSFTTPVALSSAPSSTSALVPSRVAAASSTPEISGLALSFATISTSAVMPFTLSAASSTCERTGVALSSADTSIECSCPSVFSTLSAACSIPLVLKPEAMIRLTFWVALESFSILEIMLERPGSVLSFTDTGISILIVSPIYHVTPFSYSPQSITLLKQKEKPSLRRADSLLRSAINLGVEICGGAMLIFHRP